MEQQELVEKIKGSIKNIEEKNNRIYFFVQDTRGNAKASIVYIYEMAMTLHKNGYSVIMLHEKNDFTSVSNWLDKEYETLVHQSVEGNSVNNNIHPNLSLVSIQENKEKVSILSNSFT